MRWCLRLCRDIVIAMKIIYSGRFPCDPRPQCLVDLTVCLQLLWYLWNPISDALYARIEGFS